MDPSILDQLTGGALSAPTSLLRAELIKAWLATQPAPTYEQLSEVLKLLINKDKGAARLVRERMEEIKKGQSQEALTQFWADKATKLLNSTKLNIADALAWQRDAAKEGAPISKEPLSALRGALAQRVDAIENLQHRAQVQREAAVLLAQRIEVLSTKGWQDALQQEDSLNKDIDRWSEEQSALLGHADWPSVDPKYTPALQSSSEHLRLVWEAFKEALKQTVLCSKDPAQPLPAVPAWADQIKQLRVIGSQADPATKTLKKIELDPAIKGQAKQALQLSMATLEKELEQGHGKASAGAAANLRSAMKEHGHAIDQRLEHQAQSLLSAAEELEGWQRWRADQLRTELVAKAEALLQRAKPSIEIKGNKAPKEKSSAKEVLQSANPSQEVGQNTTTQDESTQEPSIQSSLQNQLNEDAPSENLIQTENALQIIVTKEENPGADELGSTGPENHETLPAAGAESKSLQPNKNVLAIDRNKARPKPHPDYTPTMGPRKLQETLRKLREEWKLTDQGGVPNHALWKRFDNACNLAYPFVLEWLEQTRAQSEEHRTQRLNLIAEVRTWTQAHSLGPDWRAVQRQLHDFSERWRACGHVSEKVFAELQGQWKEAIRAAHLPLETLQNESISRRKLLIEEAVALGAQPTLKIDPIKALQQRWQDESHVVPIDRRVAQKLWDEFKKPLDEAFQRKTAQRAQAAQAMSEHDQAVIKASKSLEEAIQKADSALIRAAMHNLQRVSVHGESEALLNASPSVAQQEGVQIKEQTDQHSSNNASGSSEKELSANEAQTASDTKTPNESPTKSPGESHINASVDTSNPSLETTVHSELSSEISEDTGDTHKEGSQQEALDPVKEEQKPASQEASKAPKLVLAVRGDDRPSAKRTDNRSADPKARMGQAARARDSRDEKAKHGVHGKDKFSATKAQAQEPRGPRLGDAAFKAQRQALEAAQAAMHKLAVQAHGQILTNLMSAWQERNAELVPTLKELGSRVTANERSNWVKSIQLGGAEFKLESLLRMEMAADAPTPASDLQARRNLQLQLLTRRNDPTPIQTWATDAAKVFQTPYDSEVARRLQAVLKILLKH